ncbi:flagellar protein FlaG [Clostridium sp. 19966]|uniref:flagellar protein FlaG n=1 Tax=Clostridium sp. 19966 TaxID=2768166 RepID=UPI0028DEE541|nr:flagellar protein FlaG [Clostridium sp. 19966]MDT8716669.1 flagellar protein FlaG [Clostridium sp. 19966]
MEVLNNGQGGSLQIINANTTDKVIGQDGNNNISQDKNAGNITSDKNDNIKEEDVKKAVEKLNKVLEDKSTYFEYSFDKRFNQIVIAVKDKDTNKVVQELPPKKILDLVAKMCEMAGLLIDKKA